MSPEQVTIVPFQTQNEAFYVNGEQQQYLVQRIDGLTNGVCCGSNPQQDDLQTPYDGENAVSRVKHSTSATLADTPSRVNAWISQKGMTASISYWVITAELMEESK